MANKKRGFTLAELLITLSIAGLVTAMGIAITTKKMENAYNEYFYTGYTTITQLLKEAQYREEIKDYYDETGGKEYAPNNIPGFIKNIVGPYLFGIDEDDEDYKENPFSKSGITYLIRRDKDAAGTDKPYVTIIMTVPRAKTSEYPDGKAVAELHYYADVWQNPIPVTPSAQVIDVEGGTGVNLATRMDFLPCYFNQNTKSICSNGEDETGEPVIVPCNQAVTYVPPRFISLQSAFCQAMDSSNADYTDLRAELGCEAASINYNSELSSYPIKFVRPRQAHR